jgi:hypothetical protein
MQGRFYKLEIENMENTNTLQSFIKTCETFRITREEATEMWSSYHNLRKSNDKALEKLKDF